MNGGISPGWGSRPDLEDILGHLEVKETWKALTIEMPLFLDDPWHREQSPSSQEHRWPRATMTKNGLMVGRQALTMPMQFSTTAHIAGSVKCPGACQ